MSDELDCTSCENLVTIDEELPDVQDPIFVRKCYQCKENVFSVGFAKTELRTYYSKCMVRINITGHANIDDIISEVDLINDALQKIGGNKSAKFIRVDNYDAAILATSCISQSTFFQKNASLASILELDVSELRKIVKKLRRELEGLQTS